jgi:putative ABC transport system permease protein
MAESAALSSLCFPTVKCATLGGSSVNWRLDMYPAFVAENTFEEKLIIAMNDLKFAFRQLLKDPGFTTVAVVTLALGIGANAAIFSVVNAVLLRPPPFKEPGRLVFVSEKSKDMDNMSVSYPNFRDWQRQQVAFSSLAAFRTEEWNLTGTSQPERVVGLQVSASFFPTLGVQPLRGRVFEADEDKVAASASSC